MWWIASGVVLLGVLCLIPAGVWLRRSYRASAFARARRDFHLKREYLEAKFFELAAGSGKPRGLEWTACEFEDEVAYARDRQTAELAALVGITISFSAIEGGGMEHVEAVGNLRAATAVFQFREGKWRTDGRAIFNLNPTEAIRHFQSSLEMVARDQAGRVSAP